MQNVISARSKEIIKGLVVSKAYVLVTRGSEELSANICLNADEKLFICSKQPDGNRSTYRGVVIGAEDTRTAELIATYLQQKAGISPEDCEDFQIFEAKSQNELTTEEIALTLELEGPKSQRECPEWLQINELVPHLLCNNEYAQVLDIALECSSAGVASTKLAKDDKFSVEMSLYVPAVLGPKPSDLWSQAEHESAFVGLLPTAFRILTVALDDLPLAKKHSEEVAAICRQVSSTASSPNFWLLSSEIFSAALSETIPGEDLVKKANEAKKQGHDTLVVVSYMFTAVKSGYDIRHRVRAQLAAMPYVHHVLSKHTPSIYRLIVLPFLSHYWTVRVQQGRFLFSSPNIVEQSIREADSVPEAYRAQYILREVIRGLRMRMRKEEVPPWLNEMPPDYYSR